MKINASDPNVFCDLIDETGMTPESYSGRCMYGARCVSVTLPHVEIMGFGGLLARAAVELVDNATGSAVGRVDVDDVLGAIDEVNDVLRKTRQDQMGLDAVIYWPELDWPADRNDDETDDDEGEETNRG